MPTASRKQSAATSRIGNEALKEKTGKTWREWFEVFDKAGAQTLIHKDIVAIAQSAGLGQWWAQMVSVGYEQERGLRVPHEKPNGFEISVSKTIDVPVGTAYMMFQDPKMRKRWLREPEVEIRKATMNKSLRITWTDRKTSLSVDFYSKSANKTQVAVQHQKLESAKTARKMKDYWADQLEQLKNLLES
jgi:uncharacterized protein YndB with AHSA1/START domain